MERPSGNALPPGGCELRPALTPAHKQNSRKKANISPDAKFLVSREEAAEILSLSVRSVDYLLASKELPFRKIGTRTMIPSSAIKVLLKPIIRSALLFDASLRFTAANCNGVRYDASGFEMITKQTQGSSYGSQSVPGCKCE